MYIFLFYICYNKYKSYSNRFVVLNRLSYMEVATNKRKPLQTPIGVFYLNLFMDGEAFEAVIVSNLTAATIIIVM